MPRIKTYSAASGFVYQYQYQSHQSGSMGDSYLFEATEGRHARFPVTVLLRNEAISTWELQENRTLTPTERYALAKIALFNAFDDAPGPQAIPNPIEVDAGRVSEAARLLDL